MRWRYSGKKCLLTEFGVLWFWVLPVRLLQQQKRSCQTFILPTVSNSFPSESQHLRKICTSCGRSAGTIHLLRNAYVALFFYCLPPRTVFKIVASPLLSSHFLALRFFDLISPAPPLPSPSSSAPRTSQMLLGTKFTGDPFYAVVAKRKSGR